MIKMKTLITITVLLFSTNSAFADYDDAIVAYYNNDYKIAFNEFSKLAKQGDAKAQSKLGRMYYDGKGVLANTIKAIEWWKKAAEQGDSDSQNQLGVSYEMGEGVLVDYNKSAYWYKKSAELGNPTAQYNIGCFYIDGLGVNRNLSKAKYWFEKAHSNNNLNPTLRKHLEGHWKSNKLWKY